jgi:hypothetical protein
MAAALPMHVRTQISMFCGILSYAMVLPLYTTA